MNIELDRMSFDEWIQFVFERPTTDAAWFLNEDERFRISPKSLLQHCSSVFINPVATIGHFTSLQRANGLRGIVNGMDLPATIWFSNEHLDLRILCVYSMQWLFFDLFAEDPHEDLCYMWWDMFRWFGARTPPNELRLCLYRTLAAILSASSDELKLSALHGIAHLLDPAERANLLSPMLAHEGTSPFIREATEQALQGNVL